MTVSNDDDDDDGKENVVLPAAVKQSGRKWELQPAMVHVHPSSSMWPHTQEEDKHLETLIRFWIIIIMKHKSFQIHANGHYFLNSTST